MASVCNRNSRLPSFGKRRRENKEKKLRNYGCGVGKPLTQNIKGTAQFHRVSGNNCLLRGTSHLTIRHRITISLMQTAKDGEINEVKPLTNTLHLSPKQPGHAQPKQCHSSFLIGADTRQEYLRKNKTDISMHNVQ